MSRLRDLSYSAGGFALTLLVRMWMSTLRYEGVYFDASVDPTRMSFRGPAIYLFWHEYISFPFFLRGHCNVAMLLSQHRDAEALARAARQMGFETVRGSSTRGGVSALRELFKRSQSQSLTLTPDGPKGPRRKLAPGCVFLSSRLQIPLVPMGLAYDRPRRIKRAWDQHAVPRLGSRACFLMGPRLQIPPDLERDDLEHYRQIVEQWLNWVTEESERMAESDCRWEEVVVARRQPQPLGFTRNPMG